MVDGEGEDVAVGLGSHAGHSPGVGQEANLAEVGSVGQAGGDLPVGHHDVDDPLLDEVHLGADGSLLDDYITWKRRLRRKIKGSRFERHRAKVMFNGAQDSNP